jgi:hypothetical protein
MLEHAPVTLLLDVLEVIARRPARRIFLAHVTKPAGKFRETLAIGAFAKPLHGKVFGLREYGARKNCYARFEKDHVGREERSDHSKPIS